MKVCAPLPFAVSLSTRAIIEITHEEVCREWVGRTGHAVLEVQVETCKGNLGVEKSNQWSWPAEQVAVGTNMMPPAFTGTSAMPRSPVVARCCCAVKAIMKVGVVGSAPPGSNRLVVAASYTCLIEEFWSAKSLHRSR